MKHKTDNNTVTIILSLLALLLISLPAELQAEGYAGKAGAFLRMGSGAAAVAGGDAGVARAMGVEQAHYNPAGLPFSPSSEVHVGYHVLSLDRTLAHVGAMVQMGSIQYWIKPVRRLMLEQPTTDSGTGYLRPAKSSQLNEANKLEVEDYLDELVTTIYDLLQSGADPFDANYYPDLLFDAIAYTAPTLKPVVISVYTELKNDVDPSPQQIKATIEKQYKKTRENPAALGVRWTHASVGEIDGRDTDGNHYGNLNWYENRFAIVFGLKLHDKFSIGVNAGILHGRIPDMADQETTALTSTTFGADAGIQLRPFYGERIRYNLESLVLGAAVYDIEAKNSWNTSGYWDQGTATVDEFPERYRIGMSYRPIASVETFFDVETDLGDVVRTKTGVEVLLMSGLMPTTGAGSPLMRSSSTGNFGVNGLILRAGIDRDLPTFGVGLSFKLKGIGATRLDYAFVAEDVSPEPTQIVSWRFQF
ncbi:hypothetical protein K8I28_13615 [bacterium]|nr:hypothetical protein [bacterium]